jgi:methyltransferase-like protein
MMPEKRNDVICREEEFGAIIFDPQAGRMHKINKTGFFIWDLCDGTRDTEQIVEIVAERECEDTTMVKEAVEVFLKDMNSRDLIRW